MTRRKDGHDYRGPCIYMLTLITAGRRKLLGELRDADGDHPLPWVELSAYGTLVMEEWFRITQEQPHIRSLALQLMPDHLHGILYVTAPIDKHLGAVIARFKGKCTAALREDKPLSVYSATQSRTLLAWEPGFNDRILRGSGQLACWKNYLLRNPYRLWVKRNNRQYFTAIADIEIGTQHFSALGNRFLLDYPHKEVVQCSRSLTTTDIEERCNHYLELGQGGTVLVSACISPGEKEVMRRALGAGCRLIIVLDRGIAPMQKPAGRQFEACSEGRLLLVGTGEAHNDRRAITREQCLALNRIALTIARHNE